MFAAVRRKSRPKKLYNGDGRWTAATDVADLIPQPPGLLAKYLPHLEYLLIDEHRQDLAELAGMKNLVAAAIRFERPDRAAALVELIDVLNQWLEGQPELQRIFALWIRTMVLRHRRHRRVLPKARDLRELKRTLTDRFDAWAREHERKGIVQGEALLLQRQLARRFGPLPSAVVAQLGSATAEQLERWGDRVLDAASLDEVFRP